MLGIYFVSGVILFSRVLGGRNTQWITNYSF
jgi:hypothetical protein